MANPSSPDSLNGWTRLAEALLRFRRMPTAPAARRLVDGLVTLGLSEVASTAGPSATEAAAVRLQFVLRALLLDPQAPTDPAGLRQLVRSEAKRLLAETSDRNARQVLRAGKVMEPGASGYAAPAPAAVRAADRLDELEATLGLNDTDVGRLLGVSRQAVEQWRKRGIPPDRSGDVDRLAAIAEWLREELIAARIPQIVRNPVPALEGRSMLQFAEANGVLAWLDHLASLFSMQGAS